MSRLCFFSSSIEEDVWSIIFRPDDFPHQVVPPSATKKHIRESVCSS